MMVPVIRDYGGRKMKYRAFISVAVEANECLLNVWRELESSGDSLRMVKPGNLHITLKFLGDVDSSIDRSIIEVMEKALTGINPFKAEIRGMGAFPSENYIKVVWLGVDSSGMLEDISSRLVEGMKGLGFKKDKGFQGHLTLARVRSARDKKKIKRIISANRDTIFLDFPVRSIELMKSTLTPTGPIYEIVRSVPMNDAYGNRNTP